MGNFDDGFIDKEMKAKLVEFFGKYSLIKYEKGKLILKPGENFSGVVFTKSGYVAMYTLSKEGKQITAPIWRPLFFSSMVCVTTGMENNYYFETITPVEIWVAPVADWVNFAKSNEKMCWKLTKVIVGEFVAMTEMNQRIIAGDATSKVAGLIYSMGLRYGEESEKGGVKIKFNTPHRLIASMTGLTRETVTLQILRLQKEKILKVEGRRIIISDMTGLKNKAVI